MGTFEKLGILVIVVIIVMILAVAIYQWGGTGEPQLGGVGDSGGTLIIPPVHHTNPFERGGEKADRNDSDDGPNEDAWSTGHPKEYAIHPGDNLWNVVKRWDLSEGFVDAIRRANPGRDMKKLQPGDKIKIPDPRDYVRKKAAPGPKRTSATRTYEVQEGDTLGEIASKHLGSARRWREISKLNPKVTPKNLRPGMTLNLPAK